MDSSICRTEGFRNRGRESQDGGGDNEIGSTNKHDMKWKARKEGTRE